MLVQKVQQYGNSYGVIIPIAILKMLDLDKGDNLQLNVSGKKIIFRKIGDTLDEKPTKKSRKPRGGKRK